MKPLTPTDIILIVSRITGVSYDDLLDTDGNVMRFSVQTALETDIVSQKFTVRLLDGELRNTVLRARAVIATDLTEALQSLADAVHVCLGHPNAA